MKEEKMSSEQDKLSKNPFACLFRSTSQVEETIQTKNESVQQDTSVNNESKNESLNYTLEKIFLFTLDNHSFKTDKNHENACIYIGDSDTDANECINLDTMDELLLRRLQISEISDDMIRNNQSRVDNRSDLFEKREFFYLYNCISRLNKFKNDLNETTIHYLFELCVNMSKTIIELNSEDDVVMKRLSLQLIQLVNEYLDDSNNLHMYLNSLFKKFEVDNESRFLSILFENLNQSLSLKEFDYFSTQLFHYIDVVLLLTSSRFMKLIFLSTCFPKQRNMARQWQNSTILGKFLTPHFLPVDAMSTYHFLQNPTGLTQHDLDINQNNMWQRQQQINSKQIQLFKHFLLKESSEVKNKLLEWIGECIHMNRNKAQEWSKFTNANDQYASDGFFLNLLVILLDLAQPFSKPYSQSLLKIDPSYSLSASNTFDKIHFKGFDKETKFCSFDSTSISQEEQMQVKQEYNFITECFYAVHKCFQLSFINLYQKLMKINQELARTQQAYEEIRQQFQSDSLEPVRHIRSIYEKQTTEFLNIRIALTQMKLVEASTQFFSATSTWLAYLCTCKELNEPLVPIKTSNLELFKRKSSLNRYLLSMVPEFFLTNQNEFIVFLSRFQDYSVDLIINETLSNVTNEHVDHELSPIMVIILLLMGNPEYLFNPHCRAQLAECLETLLPSKASTKKQISLNIKEKRELLFKNKLCVEYLPTALLNVFVSIEMTGQSVQFEQKFNYRRPMYEILEYLWTMDTYKSKIKDLAKYAQENIENDDQPLFLRFINLLINDANYLLLEGLLYLEKIKIKQEELRNLTAGGGSPSPTFNQDRNQLEAGLKHLIMLAKFHNIMSSKTIHAFRLLTSEISYFFCEAILVDRVATMLNDFLLHLVGSKRKSLKVANFKEVEFNPSDIVSTICDIYLNLGSNDEFCKAVCRDGRSYSKDLFALATVVLKQINRPVHELEALGEKIQEISRIQQMEDSNYDDAPEEFLDPIMSSLMVDPVLLPTSKKIVDRSTISRHLLSDQTDPFNRMPLSLQDVVPDVDLKQRIEDWKKSKRAKSSS